MVINAGGGSEGFSIKNGNFAWSEQKGFGGWLGKCEEGGELLTSLSFFPTTPESIRSNSWTD